MNATIKSRIFGSAPTSVRIAFVALCLVGLIIVIGLLSGVFTHRHPTGSTFTSEVFPFALIAMLAANILIFPYRHPSSKKAQWNHSLFAGAMALICMMLALDSNKDATQHVRFVKNAMGNYTTIKDQKEALAASQQKITELCALAATTDSNAMKQACD